MKLVNVKEDSSFKRDAETQAILNVDNKALAAYKRKRASDQALRNEIDDLKNDINGIKQMLEEVLKRV